MYFPAPPPSPATAVPIMHTFWVPNLNIGHFMISHLEFDFYLLIDQESHKRPHQLDCTSQHTAWGRKEEVRAQEQIQGHRLLGREDKELQKFHNSTSLICVGWHNSGSKTANVVRHSRPYAWSSGAEAEEQSLTNKWHWPLLLPEVCHQRLQEDTEGVGDPIQGQVTQKTEQILSSYFCLNGPLHPWVFLFVTYGEFLTCFLDLWSNCNMLSQI